MIYILGFSLTLQFGCVLYLMSHFTHHINITTLIFVCEWSERMHGQVTFLSLLIKWLLPPLPAVAVLLFLIPPLHGWFWQVGGYMPCVHVCMCVCVWVCVCLQGLRKEIWGLGGSSPNWISWSGAYTPPPPPPPPPPKKKGGKKTFGPNVWPTRHHSTVGVSDH